MERDETRKNDNNINNNLKTEQSIKQAQIKADERRKSSEVFHFII
jgi:hypothetical protein